MSGSGELSIVTVVALVMGGLAALVLAIAVANRDAHRVKSATAVGSAQVAPRQAPLGSAAPSPAEVEVPAELLYPVDADAPADPR